MKQTLYIELRKAVTSIPNGSLDTPAADQQERENEASYDQTPAGVSGGDPSKDDKDQGKNWKHDDDDEDGEKSVKKSLNEVKKSIRESSVDLVKSFSKSMKQEYNRMQPMSAETEYLTQVCGYAEEDIRKGFAVIKGQERAKFQDWLCKRFKNSAGKLNT